MVLEREVGIFHSFFSFNEEVAITFAITKAIVISGIINDTTKIFTISKMGDGVLKIYVKGNIFFQYSAISIYHLYIHELWKY